MADLKSRILEIIQQPQLCGFATITLDGKPWVRYVVTMGNDKMELRFATAVESRKVKQIDTNPEVHLTCGAAGLTDMKPYLQIQGRARLATDAEERNAFWSDMLANYFSGPDDPNYGVVVIEPYLIEYCGTPEMEPGVWTRE